MKLKEFQNNLITEFQLNSDTFKCYTLESNPFIKVFLFGKKECESCNIGLLINGDFHILGDDSFRKEDVKTLYISLVHCLPEDEQKLKIRECTFFSDEEQKRITDKLTEFFKKQSKQS